MIIWNFRACICDNGVYLKSVIDESVITYDEITEVKKTNPIKTIPTNFEEKKVTCKTENLYILILFYQLPCRYW